MCVERERKRQREVEEKAGRQKETTFDNKLKEVRIPNSSNIPALWL